MKFALYPEYVESKTAWLGGVPAHWALRRLGYCFNERRGKVSDRDYQALSVTRNGIVPQLETAAKTDDGENRRLVLKGDFVINSRSDRKGSSGLSNLDGSVSLISSVLTAREPVVMEFFSYLFRSVPFQEEFYRYGRGIVADLWTTRFDDMRNILLAVPSASEQTAISKFLDRETTKIDALIAEQERLIGLLEEKRQAVISHAVTKGLDRTAPMKDSGIEWLGDVPEQWGVKRVKYVTESLDQGWSPQCESYPAEDTNTWGVLKVGCVNGGNFNPKDNKTLPDNLDPIPALSLRAGDVLISRANTRELVGSAAVVPADCPRLMLCDKLYRVRLFESECLPRLLAFFLSSNAARGQIEIAAGGASSSMLNIPQDAILDLSMPIPPLGEQHRILTFLGEELFLNGELTVESTRAIALLKERRSALISAAVTGKIDVRGLIADTLPMQEAAE